MLWLKRNLFLSIGGLATVLLLAWGVYFMLSKIQENKRIEADIEEKKAALDKISRTEPFPSQSNIDIVRKDGRNLRALIDKMRSYFPLIPSQRVAGQEFATLLNNTLDELRKKADQLNVSLPSKKYAFSFEAQRDKLNFGPGSFPALPAQLADVRLLTHVVLDAKVNKLINIRRTPVSLEDERSRGTADYHELQITTNANTGTITRPYQFEFECFSAELASILENLCKAQYAFVVKSIAVTPAEPSPTASLTPSGGQPAVATPNVPIAPIRPRGRYPGAGAGVVPGRRVNPSAPAGASVQELKTVLSERLLKIVVLVDVIQPGR